VLEGKIGRKLSREGVKAGRKRRLNELLAAEPLRPGVREWLSDAQRLGLGAAVASSAPRRWVEPRLEALGVRPFFRAVKCAEDAARAKPAPDLFLAAAGALAVPPAECLALEDSPNGIAAARAAGTYCLAVPNEVTKHLDLSGADLVAPSLAELTLEDFIARAEARSPDRR
jgi:HAD superfamily hydrolase (TIGR01509 family)